MKKIVFLLCVLMIFSNCGYIKEYPTATLELSKGGEDNSTFNFEQSDYGFIINAIPADNAAFISKELSSDRAYKGKKSLKIKCNYTGTVPYKAGLLTMQYGTAQNFKNKKIKAYVWIPGNAFDEKTPYGSNFYVKSGAPNWAWYQSPGNWTNLKQGTVVVDGVWTEITVNCNDMIKPPPPYGDGSKITDQELANIVEFGIKVGQGDYSKNFDGYIYIDSISIE